MFPTKTNLKNIHKLVKQGYISACDNPLMGYTLYNYTPKAQYERVWTEETLNCRGLILDKEGKVIARPFPKFFNLEERTEPLPNEPFEVFEKYDGSLGIAYPFGDHWFIATRGSFFSDQAMVATELLHTKYKNFRFTKGFTYLFEIIYPENRIVLDYGDKKELILLTVIENATGLEVPHDLLEKGLATVFPLAECYDGVKDISTLTAKNNDNHEGFVVRFKSGLRVKVKYEEYKRLHRILTQVNSKTIWEYLRDHKSLEELLDRVPDEFYDWVKTTATDITDNYKEIERQALVWYEQAKLLPDRKSQAQLVLDKGAISSIIFSMLDGKDYETVIWKMVRPITYKPFKENEE